MTLVKWLCLGLGSNRTFHAIISRVLKYNEPLMEFPSEGESPPKRHVNPHQLVPSRDQIGPMTYVRRDPTGGGLVLIVLA